MSDRPRPGLVVPDSSVAAKWYLGDEPHTDRAGGILRAFGEGSLTLVVPDCFVYELGNLIRTAERRARLTPDQADRIFEAIAGMAIPVVSVRELLGDAVALSRAYDVSLYDALYLALAGLVDATFVTADDALLRRVPQLGYVRSLASF